MLIDDIDTGSKEQRHKYVSGIASKQQRNRSNMIFFVYLHVKTFQNKIQLGSKSCLKKNLPSQAPLEE
jgi:hypothetical protein